MLPEIFGKIHGHKAFPAAETYVNHHILTQNRLPEQYNQWAAYTIEAFANEQSTSSIALTLRATILRRLLEKSDHQIGFIVDPIRKCPEFAVIPAGGSHLLLRMPRFDEKLPDPPNEWYLLGNYPLLINAERSSITCEWNTKKTEAPKGSDHYSANVKSTTSIIPSGSVTRSVEITDIKGADDAITLGGNVSKTIQIFNRDGSQYTLRMDLQPKDVSKVSAVRAIRKKGDYNGLSLDVQGNPDENVELVPFENTDALKFVAGGSVIVTAQLLTPLQTLENLTPDRAVNEYLMKDPGDFLGRVALSTHNILNHSSVAIQWNRPFLKGK